MKRVICLIAAGLLACGVLTAQNTGKVTVETMPPVVVKTIPAAGDTDVDPKLRQIRVVFSKPMMTNEQWSVVTVSQDTLPKIVGQVHFLKDKKTFIIPVKFEPGKPYAVWLNRGQYNYFKDERGNSAVPYLLVFQTR